MKKTMLILSGPTHEYIDPVRYMGNASSGQLGQAIAETAVARGYHVEFVTGPVCNAHLPNLQHNGSIHSVVSAKEMLATATPLFTQATAAIFVAAVADYAPAEIRTQKMQRQEDVLQLNLVPNPDIAATLCAHKKAPQKAIGFALQTEAGEVHARRKLAEKNLDGIVLNTPATLGAQTGTFSYLSTSSESFEQWGSIPKTACAIHILDALDALFV